jgi:hypothetical protein
MHSVEHRRLGTITYAWPKHWAYHYEAAHDAFEQLDHLHEELAALPVGPDSMRSSTTSSSSAGSTTPAASSCPKEPAVLHIEMRGLRSMRQFKKPPWTKSQQ